MIQRQRRRRRSSLPLALLIAAAFLTLAALAWFRLPAPIAHALLYVLAAWAGAAAVMFPLFLAVSVDDLGDIAAAALRGAAPAMWFPPALLLLSSSNPAAEAAALALTAFAACLLATQHAPPKRVHAPAPAAAPPRLFRDPGIQQSLFSGSFSPVMLGALALQAALWALYMQYRLAAALLTAFAAALWTRSWIARGAAGPPRNPLTRSIAAIVLTLVLSIALAGTPVPDAPEPPAADRSTGILTESTRVLARLARPDPLKPAAAAPKAVALADVSRRHAPEVSGIPGVILRTAAKPRPQNRLIAPTVPGAIRSFGDSLTFPFTGEYHIFRTASGHLPAGAPVEEGTPLDAVFISATGSGSLETQAVQPLIPPMDFSRCGEILLTLRSGEGFGADASLQLVTDAGSENLGAEFFGTRSDAEETVTYAVPFSPHRAPVRALRVIFGHIPGFGHGPNQERSTKVAVLRITLVPRGY